MEALQNILIRNAVCGLLFLLMLVVQFSNMINEPYKKYGTIALLVLFVLVLPLRSSFRYVWRRLGLGASHDSSRGA